MRADRAGIAASRRQDPVRASSTATAPASVPDHRLASGPGLVGAAFGLDRSWTGTDLCDPASALRLEPGDPVADARASSPRRASASTTPASPGRASRGDWRSPASRRLRPRAPSLTSHADGRPLDRPARVPARAGAPRRGHLVPAVAPPRRDARALLGPGRSSPLASTRPTRPAACSCERPGVGIGSAHDIGPAVERAARGGRLEPAQFLELAETLDATARLATILADERRPLLRDLGRELHPLPSVRSTLARSFDPVGELLDTASPRLGGLRAAVRVAYDRLRRRLDALVGAELGSALQEPIITLRNGRYVVPVKAEARSRVKGIVHDASGSGQTLFIEPLVAVELGNAWREAQVAEAEEVARILDELSALDRRERGRPARDARCARPVRLLGGQGVARGRHGRRPRRDGGRGHGRPPVGPPPRPDRTGRADRHPPRRRHPGPRRHRAEHRRQDRHAADARPAQPHAPGRAARPGRDRQPAAGLARRLRRHRRRAVDRAVALDVLRAPALDHPDRRRRPDRGRWCSSTSSAPAPTRPRVRRSPRRCSTTSSVPARSSRRRPTTPSSRPTPTRPRARRTPRSSSTSRR